MKRHLPTWAVVVLLAVASLAFVPGIRGPFLLDDLSSIPKAKPGTLSVEETIDLAIKNRAGLLRRPVASLSFTANHLIERDAPLSFKVTNVVLHALAALLVFLFSIEILRALQPSWDAVRVRWTSLLAASIFLLHPLQVSTVLYVVQRMALLATLFTIAALLIASRFLAESRVTRTRFVAASIGFWACFVFAIGSKESAVLLPPLALLVYMVIDTAPRERLHRFFVAHAAVLPIVLGLLLLPFAWDAMFRGYVERAWDMGDRIATQPVVLWFYVSLFAAPLVQRMGLYHDDFPVFEPFDAASVLAILAIAAVTVLAFRLRRTMPLLGFAVAWFLVSHLLESTVLPLELVFEHRNYLALIGPMIAVAAGLSALWSNRSSVVRAVPWVLVGLLGLATAHRSMTWSSSPRFHAHELANHPHSPRALLYAASEAVAAGDVEAGRRHVERIKERVPNAAWPWLLDAHVACSVPDAAVDWPRIERTVADPRLTEYDVGALIALTKRFLPPASCGLLDRAGLDRVLVLAGETALRSGNGKRAQTMLVLRSQLARSAGRTDDAVAMLRSAALLDPPGVEVLADLAYLQLNAGSVGDAAETIATLRRAADEQRLPIGYRVEELERALADARRGAPPATLDR